MSSTVCTQCKQPLALDASLVDLAPSAYDMMASSLPRSPHHLHPSESEKLAQLPAPSSVKALWHNAAQSPGHLLSPRAQEKQREPGISIPGESFVLLQDSVVHNIPSQPPTSPPPRHQRLSFNARTSSGPSGSAVKRNSGSPSQQPVPLPVAAPPSPSPLFHHLESTARLFKLLSSRTELDHPLCAECTYLLIATLNKQLEETKKERDGYLAFEKEIKKEREREKHAASPEATERKIQRLKEDERNAIHELKAAESEREKLSEEIRALEREERELEEEEAEFWRVHNENLLTAAEQNSQLRSLRAAYAADSQTLEKLQRTNVYYDAFCIGNVGVFGTINGLRLGRASGIAVEWSEINAAWGQCTLLLYTLARKLEFTFENYRPVPIGSFSHIEKISGTDKAIYELYGSGDLHFGRILHNRRFDLGMVAYLDCLRQLMEYVQTQYPNADFPHPIVKDKIGDVSIKLQFSQEESWTRALRHVLLALKLLLKLVTNTGPG
ncbi:APG6-domain-containing protein [Hysterangium stoloniferum]|nr:APG6-domain-containing protein [Hysterangium stoloniferum]